MSDQAKSKHTPGPWMSLYAVTEVGRFVVISETAITLALVTMHDQCSLGEQRANSLLMAAAPDLYEALDLLMSAIMNELSMRPANSIPETVHAMQLARLAINKVG